MEFYVGALLGVLTGLIGLLVGSRWHPKNKTQRDMQEFYERSIAVLKAEVKAMRSKVSYYQKGAIPRELGSTTGEDPAALVDGIMQALPPNWRSILATFRPQIVAEMKNNPEATSAVIATLKAKLGGQGKEGQEAVSPDAI